MHATISSPSLRCLALLSILAFAACGGAGDRSAEGGCPVSGNAAAARGWEAYRMGDMKDARAAFEESRDVCEDHVGARTGLGFVAIREGRDDDATSLLSGVIDDDVDNVDAHAGLGILAWRAGDTAAVRAHFVRVLELDPAHEEARSYLERVGPPADSTVP